MDERRFVEDRDTLLEELTRPRERRPLLGVALLDQDTALEAQARESADTLAVIKAGSLSLADRVGQLLFMDRQPESLVAVEASPIARLGDAVAGADGSCRLRCRLPREEWMGTETRRHNAGADPALARRLRIDEGEITCMPYSRESGQKRS